MIRVPGGAGRMGSDAFYAEERPVVTSTIGDVWWDPSPVTNVEFARFVEVTGHRTVAEVAPDAADFPGADPTLLVAGSQVFTQARGPVPLHDWTLWWRWQPGACWRAPQGPGSTWEDVADHPVVHVGWEDATAYALWAGKQLATEAEWEHAAWGGATDGEYAWGQELHPGGQVLANTWMGPFPWRSDDPRGHHRTSSVASYPANGFGLHDMIGNVWEWTASDWSPSHAEQARGPAPVGAAPCCGGAARPGGPGAVTVVETDRKVTKGGSHLCSPGYCRRYRPASRQGHGVRDTTSHVGFRCVQRA